MSNNFILPPSVEVQDVEAFLVTVAEALEINHSEGLLNALGHESHEALCAATGFAPKDVETLCECALHLVQAQEVNIQNLLDILAEQHMLNHPEE